MRALNLLPIILLAACNGVAETDGIGEPLFVTGATFVPGAMPGHTPRASGEAAGPGPQVLDIETASALLPQGQVGHPFSGHTSTDAYSIGVKLQGAGSGYWLMPVAGPDPTQDNDLTFNFLANVAFSAPLGNGDVLFVAFDSKGNAGDQQTLTDCVSSDLPDNLNSCDPTRKPPATIVSLSWDSNADLDIILHTPDGKIVDSKHPTTAPLQGSTVPTMYLPPTDPTTGYIDQDSNSDCVEDNQRHEDAVWESAPSGTFNIYVNEFSACGTQASTFKVTTYQRQTSADGKTYSLVQSAQVSGQVLDSQANGGSGSPLYVASVSFP